jgi:hypothetical protein
MEIHALLIQTLLNQAKRSTYLETFKITTMNEDVEIAYMTLVEKDIEEIGDY